MFKIGDFSKICQISNKALRHWDEMGLLKPAHVDAESGYRYYTIAQLYDVNRVLALREMGLTLKQIHRLISKDVSADEIRGMFLLKKTELESEIEHAQARLRMLEARLNHLNKETPTFGDYTIRVIQSEAHPFYALRRTYTNISAFAQYLTTIYNDFHRESDQQFVAVFHDDAYQQEGLDVEIGFTCTDAQAKVITPPDDHAWGLTTLPTVLTLATTIHRGGWITLSEGYNALGRWIHDNGYEIIGAGREIFHRISKDDAEDFITELQFPVQLR